MPGWRVAQQIVRWLREKPGFESAMVELPRIAIGTVQPQAEPAVMAWALMDAAARCGTRVQSFLSHAYFCPRDGATAITGSPPRHLDSWLMPESMCRDLFYRGARASDLALVEGHFFGEAKEPQMPGSELTTLCAWLDLPRLAVVDARLLRACRLPPRPEVLDGVLLDRVRDTAEFAQLQTQFESLWKVPVLGWLGPLEAVRAEIAKVDCGQQPALELCHALGEAFARYARLEAILTLAARRPFALAEQPCGGACHCAEKDLRVAVAYDEVFGGYFPDTLDLLEARAPRFATFRRCATSGCQRTRTSFTSAVAIPSDLPASCRKTIA